MFEENIRLYKSENMVWGKNLKKLLRRSGIVMILNLDIHARKWGFIITVIYGTPMPPTTLTKWL
jgi:hypothetical protein